MDDLDDLLDDVERDLNKKQVTSSRKAETPKSKLVVTYQGPAQDLEEDISFILEDTADAVQFATKRNKGNVTKCLSSKTKCLSVFLGGPTLPKGASSMSNKRCCESMRCTSCDFRVERYENFTWQKDVNYLFLRNNMPDFEKVASKLRKKRGSCAYACQCSWTSAIDFTPLPSGLKWVCGKH